MARAEEPRYLGAEAFRRALPMEAAIEAMEAAFRAESEGSVRASDRQTMEEPLDGGRRSLLLTMPAAWSGRAFATKVVGYLADNPAHGRPAVQGVAVLIDATTGAPRLITDAGILTQVRTGAMVGLATDRLARADATRLGLVGTGALALDMIRAVAAVRPLEQVLAYNRTASRAAALVPRSPVPMRVVETAEAAAREADVLIVATPSQLPVVADRAIAPGTHVNAVGCFRPDGRELEGATVGRADLWVDGVESAISEAGDLLLAAREGHIGPLPGSLRGDLAALASGGRREPERELTLFKSVGTATADLGALVAAEAAAVRLDLGLRLI